MLAVLALPSAGSASEPPNHNDPCAHTGRNVCATAGVGYYKTYRYGLRWFGDFRGVGTADRHLYCIDLRYWYPASSFHYTEATGGVLRNRDGKVVSLAAQAQISYAIFTYGQTTNADQAAAVMLYVHAMIGDGRPGETDPTGLGPRVTRLYRRIARDAARLRGPYTVRTHVTGGGVVGGTGDVQVEVISATGARVPGVTIAIASQGASGVPTSVRTDARGLGHVPFRLTTTGGFHLTLRTARLAAPQPRILAPSTNAAVANAQRLAAPDGAQAAADVRVGAAPAQIQAMTSATPSSLQVGGTSTEHVTITGALPTWSATVSARLYGPFATQDALDCSGTPFAQVSFPATGAQTAYDAPAVTVTTPGWYTWIDEVPGDANDTGLTTDCKVPAESFHVDVTPALSTTVSAPRVAPGAAIHDTIVVSGLAGLSATVHAALYGPFSSPATIACDGTPAWQGSVSATGDGTYQTETYPLTVAGYYTYREWIEASGLVHAAQTTCGDVAETVVAVAHAAISTQVSAAQAAPGTPLTDAVQIGALGAISVQVTVDLYGPYASAAAVDCSGTPASTSTIAALHDGTYVSTATRPLVAGYYAFRESVAQGPANDAVQTPCAEPGETAYIHASPTISTTASPDVVRVGAAVSDDILVRGLGRTPATIDVALYGPFAARAAIDCTGTPVFARTIAVTGDGLVHSPSARVAHIGFYAWTEHLRGTALVSDTTTTCGLVDETTFGVAGISTGRGDVAIETRARHRSSMEPVRVRIARPGVDAPVVPVGLDMAHGLLGVPSNVRRTGWWTDGALPGSRSGAILIGGHVDSAAAGPGAFAPLSYARSGDIVQVTTASGRVLRYRVTSVRSYPKPKLPTSVWSLRGPARLVLVTCGGRFDTTTHHYLDNIVVTAVPITR